MSEQEKRVLICYRVADLDEGPPAQSFLAICHYCKLAIWVAYSSPPVDEKICLQCAEQEITLDSKFAPITPEQLAEIELFAPRLASRLRRRRARRRN